MLHYLKSSIHDCHFQVLAKDLHHMDFYYLLDGTSFWRAPYTFIPKILYVLKTNWKEPFSFHFLVAVIKKFHHIFCVFQKGFGLTGILLTKYWDFQPHFCFPWFLTISSVSLFCSLSLFIYYLLRSYWHFCQAI